MEKRVILLVVEEPNDLAVLSDILRPTYEVLACKSGEEALRAAAGEPGPDLILLDVSLPGMDGYTIWDTLREGEHARDVPVIFVTESDHGWVERKGLLQGGADSLCRPFKPAVVRARVAVHLETKQARDGLAREMEARKKAERTLEELELKFRVLADGAYDFQQWKSPGGQLLYLSPSWERLTGYPVSEVEKDPKFPLRIVHPEDLDRLKAHEELAMSSDASLELEFRILHRDGTVRWIEHGCQPVFDGNGTFLGRRTTDRDITRRRGAEAALERQKRTLQRIIDKSHTHLVYLDPDFNFLALNATYAQTCQRTPEELIGKNHFHFYPHEENEAIFRQARETGQTVFFHDKPFTFPDQPERGITYWDWTLTPVQDESNRVEGLVFSLVETTERKRAEEALEESRAWLRLALQSASMGAWYWDPIEDKCYGDDQAFRLMGIESTKSAVDVERFFEAVHPDDRDKVRRALVKCIEQDLPFQLECRFIRPEGSVRYVSCRAGLVRDEGGRPLRLNGVLWDVTEEKWAEEKRKDLEDRLHQARKAESLGRMAGAIAHSFNNLFSVALGRLELAMMDLPPGSGAAEDVVEAVTALERSTNISHLMLAYLGQSVGKKVRINLTEICRQSLPLLTSSLPEKVHLKLDLPRKKTLVQADLGQVTTVLSNLAINAAEAMGGREGVVTLALGVVSAADLRTTRFYPAEWEPRDEHYACLSVRDNGVGMDQDILEKVFDPFFSTKFTGRGLGLSVVLGIVKAHRGAITVESIPGRGSTFRILLPLWVEALPTPSGLKPTDAVAPEDRGLVLLVDDESMLRSLVSLALEELGYGVITAADGVEALELFREHREQVQCVVLDLMMPRMGGWETLAALRAIRPDLPIILSSGYDEARAMQNRQVEQPQAFLAKPYKMRDLEEALAAALRGRLKKSSHQRQ